MTKKIVLLIEDSQWSSANQLRKISDKEVEIIAVPIEKTALTLGSLHVDICVIDACKGPHREICTASLVKIVRALFKGPVIAISYTAPSRVPLMIAGCNYETSKGNLPKLLQTKLLS